MCQAAAPAFMELFVRNLDNKLTLVRILPSNTFADLKSLLEQKENVPAYKFRLDYGGRIVGGKGTTIEGDALVCDFVGQYHTIDMMPRAFLPRKVDQKGKPVDDGEVVDNDSDVKGDAQKVEIKD